MQIEIKADTWAEAVTSLAVAVAWIVGIVLANGFWSTLLALIFPPWGWYLIAERWMQSIGWIAS